MSARGALAIWLDVDSADEAALNDWYRHQHLGERLSVPGFVRGRRYETVAGGPRYFTMYETESPETLRSAAYLDRLNAPTDWTRRALPLIRRMRRNVYRRLAEAGALQTERYLTTARVQPHSGRGPHVKASLLAEGLSGASDLAGVCGTILYETEAAGTSVETEERRIVGGEVSAATPFLALCELEAPEAGIAVRDFWAGWGRQMAADVTVDIYRLMYGLAWLEVGRG